ncbi:hypothetical protein [Arthrobacter alpinus]|uniref:hypothetical protein n=1 Tax=Arthrobacter alpinus TaxID=656366 RepID=UPI001645DF26|nr:hypothetical protein [Arthrobacter alpinus]
MTNISSFMRLLSLNVNGIMRKCVAPRPVALVVSGARNSKLDLAQASAVLFRPFDIRYRNTPIIACPDKEKFSWLTIDDEAVDFGIPSVYLTSGSLLCMH